MLFDLRSRGRRRTVQVVYIFLALLMVGGLLLVGVGTGSGGGILNAFTNNGSGGGNVAQQLAKTERQAQKKVNANPQDAAALQDLIVDQWTQVDRAPFLKASGFTKAGKAELQSMLTNWKKYQNLTTSPDPTTATLIAHASYFLSDFTTETAAWEAFANANPTSVNAFKCLAAAASAAGQTRKFQLAVQQALALTASGARAVLAKSLTAAQMPQEQAECIA